MPDELNSPNHQAVVTAQFSTKGDNKILKGQLIDMEIPDTWVLLVQGFQEEQGYSCARRPVLFLHVKGPSTQQVAPFFSKPYIVEKKAVKLGTRRMSRFKVAVSPLLGHRLSITSLLWYCEGTHRVGLGDEPSNFQSP